MSRLPVNLSVAEIEALEAILAAVRGTEPACTPAKKTSKARVLPAILNADEIDSLLAAALEAANVARTPSKQAVAWRDFVMIQTGLLAGPRVSELCKLEVTDVDLASAVLSIRQGKGKKDRRVWLGNRLLTVLRAWIGERTAGYLFPGPNGRRLSPRTFQVRLERIVAAAKIMKPTHPHTLRHCFATALLKKGVNIRIIQRLLGHSSVAVTELYTHVEDGEMKKAVDLL